MRDLVACCRTLPDYTEATKHRLVNRVCQHLWLGNFSQPTPTGSNRYPVPTKTVSTPDLDKTALDYKLTKDATLLVYLHMNKGHTPAVNSVCSQQWFCAAKAPKLMLPTSWHYKEQSSESLFSSVMPSKQILHIKETGSNSSKLSSPSGTYPGGAVPIHECFILTSQAD